MEIANNVKKILILVPHEDDEILMTAGIIEEAVRSRINVKVVMATNGDYEGSDKESGSVRLAETLAGLKLLGLSEEAVIFLGYADTGMEESKSFIHGLYLESEEEKVHAGHCSCETYALPGHADFHTKRFGAPAAYTRKNFKGDLKEIISSEQPELLFTTSVEDMHGDHSGLFLFVREILGELKQESAYAPVLYSGLVHSKAGDEVWPKRSAKPLPFTCPEGLSEGTLCWEERISFPVPAGMRTENLTENRKAMALASHKSALKEDAVEFLYSFLKTEEIFWNTTEMEKKHGI